MKFLETPGKVMEIFILTLENLKNYIWKSNPSC